MTSATQFARKSASHSVGEIVVSSRRSTVARTSALGGYGLGMLDRGIFVTRVQPSVLEASDVVR
jgi:hypothetical protein